MFGHLFGKNAEKNTKSVNDFQKTVYSIGSNPLPAVFLPSPYNEIPDNDESFESRAKRCAMGDLGSMFWMFKEFQNRLPEAYKVLEMVCIRDFSEENIKKLNDYLNEHTDVFLYLQAALMWLNRSALYGFERAMIMLEEYPFFRQDPYFGTFFQIPGKGQRKGCKGKTLREMGLLDFQEEVSYDMESLNHNGIYVGSCYVSYSGLDETGFGMEDEYDYYFFDEFFRLLFILRGWSTRDIRNNQDRIQSLCTEKREEKQREREQFWDIYNKASDMVKYYPLKPLKTTSVPPSAHWKGD